MNSKYCSFNNNSKSSRRETLLWHLKDGDNASSIRCLLLECSKKWGNAVLSWHWWIRHVRLAATCRWLVKLLILGRIFFFWLTLKWNAPAYRKRTNMPTEAKALWLNPDVQSVGQPSGSRWMKWGEWDSNCSSTQCAEIEQSTDIEPSAGTNTKEIHCHYTSIQSKRALAFLPSKTCSKRPTTTVLRYAVWARQSPDLGGYTRYHLEGLPHCRTALLGIA